jgi:multicomponent Na+:H+ antiporter subunit E
MSGAHTVWKVLRILITTVYLFGGWLLFTGTLEPQFIVTGGVFSVLVAFLTYDAFIDESEASWKTLFPRVHWFVVYVFYVVYKIYLASFKVLMAVLRHRINPRVVHFRTRLRSDIARVFLANSLTITPGTIALELDDDHLIVHWLDAETTHSRRAGELIAGHMESILKRIWV